MRVPDRTIIWDDIDIAPIVSSLVGFQMHDIEILNGIRCPRAHLRLYALVMRVLGRDDTQMVALFPLSLSGAAQHWFALLDPSKRWTWGELA